MNKVNLLQKFELINEYWSPKIAGELNGQMVKLVKFKGEFVWHKHDHEDELFWVIKGTFKMDLRDKPLFIEEGEFIIIPRGVEHKPVADNEVWVVLFEPATTLNTGNVVNEMTIEKLQSI
jgi:mannose-6-phosphate isomerase-like protein (cupin superfamily)